MSACPRRDSGRPHKSDSPSPAVAARGTDPAGGRGGARGPDPGTGSGSVAEAAPDSRDLARDRARRARPSNLDSPRCLDSRRAAQGLQHGLATACGRAKHPPDPARRGRLPGGHLAVDRSSDHGHLRPDHPERACGRHRRRGDRGGRAAPGLAVGESHRQPRIPAPGRPCPGAPGSADRGRKESARPRGPRRGRGGSRVRAGRAGGRAGRDPGPSVRVWNSSERGSGRSEAGTYDVGAKALVRSRLIRAQPPAHRITLDGRSRRAPDGLEGQGLATPRGSSQPRGSTGSG